MTVEPKGLGRKLAGKNHTNCSLPWAVSQESTSDHSWMTTQGEVQPHSVLEYLGGAGYAETEVNDFSTTGVETGRGTGESMKLTGLPVRPSQQTVSQWEALFAGHSSNFSMFRGPVMAALTCHTVTGKMGAKPAGATREQCGQLNETLFQNKK